MFEFKIMSTCVIVGAFLCATLILVFFFFCYGQHTLPFVERNFSLLPLSMSPFLVLKETLKDISCNHIERSVFHLI